MKQECYDKQRPSHCSPALVDVHNKQIIIDCVFGVHIDVLCQVQVHQENMSHGVAGSLKQNGSLQKGATNSSTSLMFFQKV